MSVWNFIAPAAGGILGGIIANRIIPDGGIMTTLIGGGLGAVLGIFVKNIISPDQPAVSAPGGTRSPTGGPGLSRPGLSEERSAELDRTFGTRRPARAPEEAGATAPETAPPSASMTPPNMEELMSAYRNTPAGGSTVPLRPRDDAGAAPTL